MDRHGTVLRPAILWNDGRCGRECAELIARIPDFLTRASNTAMPGFTAPKLLWVARHEPEIFAATAKVLLPKDYLRFRLSGAYVSDMSDSAGTLWLDVGRRSWDEVLLNASGMKRAQMPDLVEGSEISSYLSSDVAASWGLTDRKIPIAGGGGDNASSAVGIGAVDPGDGFLSLGTSGVLFVSTDRLVSLPERTLHGFCHALPNRWHGMVVTLSAASALSWLGSLTGHEHDIGGLIGKANAFAADPGRRESAPVFLPYLTGERTPHNDPNATAKFDGLRAEHDAGALAYGVLEGVAFALADGLDVLKAANAAPRSCMLVGGGSRSAYWNALLADVWDYHSICRKGRKSAQRLEQPGWQWWLPVRGQSRPSAASPQFVPVSNLIRPKAQFSLNGAIAIFGCIQLHLLPDGLRRERAARAPIRSGRIASPCCAGTAGRCPSLLPRPLRPGARRQGRRRLAAAC